MEAEKPKSFNFVLYEKFYYHPFHNTLIASRLHSSYLPSIQNLLSSAFLGESTGLAASLPPLFLFLSEFELVTLSKSYWLTAYALSYCCLIRSARSVF